MQEKIREDVRTILIPRVKARLERAKDKLARLIGDDYILHVNPTGKFVIGGPHGDTGLTGRKIIVDSYGGRGAHGGGAFSGKDSSKVDRSAAYAARYIAKNMVAAGIADEILVELSYAIGIAEPISVFVDTHGAVCSRNPKLADMTDGEIARRIAKLFDLRPAAIVKKFGLKNPIFEATASYGHFGNRPYTRKEKVWEDGREVEREIEFFGWEKLDAVDLIKQEFGLYATDRTSKKSPFRGLFVVSSRWNRTTEFFRASQTENRLRDGRSMQVPEPPGIYCEGCELFVHSPRSLLI